MTDSSDPRQPAPGNALAATDPQPTALDAHGYDPADYDWVPVLRKPRADGWTPQRQVAFIGALADTGNVLDAARQVAMTPSGAYALRRAPGGEAFAAAWDAAMHQAAHALIDVAFDRAFNGSDEPVYNRDGQVVGRKHRQSDAMIMFMLRKHFPKRYGDLHRDRPERAAAPATPAVAQTMIALEPVRPADPLANDHPDDVEIKLQMAAIGEGKLAHFHRQDGSEERDYDPEADGLGTDFEAKLEAAKREGNPAAFRRAKAIRAFHDEEEQEERERRMRRRGRR